MAHAKWCTQETAGSFLQFFAVFFLFFACLQGDSRVWEAQFFALFFSLLRCFFCSFALFPAQTIKALSVPLSALLMTKFASAALLCYASRRMSAVHGVQWSQRSALRSSAHRPTESKGVSSIKPQNREPYVLEMCLAVYHSGRKSGRYITYLEGPEYSEYVMRSVYLLVSGASYYHRRQNYYKKTRYKIILEAIHVVTIPKTLCIWLQKHQKLLHIWKCFRELFCNDFDQDGMIEVYIRDSCLPFCLAKWLCLAVTLHVTWCSDVSRGLQECVSAKWASPSMLACWMAQAVYVVRLGTA